ncbi:MAG: hypothetical protein MJE77_01330 [Proteobacteria bacterium]|nr:hypothetical protein [Pseudomonadota bacterium]
MQPISGFGEFGESGQSDTWLPIGSPFSVAAQTPSHLRVGAWPGFDETSVD